MTCTIFDEFHRNIIEHFHHNHHHHQTTDHLDDLNQLDDVLFELFVEDFITMLQTLFDRWIVQQQQQQHQTR